VGHIEVELALPVFQRKEAGKLLQDLREKMARISEIAPPLPDGVIREFQKLTKDSKISKPILTNGLDPIVVCKEEKWHGKEAEYEKVKQEYEKANEDRKDMMYRLPEQPLPNTTESHEFTEVTATSNE